MKLIYLTTLILLFSSSYLQAQSCLGLYDNLGNRIDIYKLKNQNYGFSPSQNPHFIFPGTEATYQAGKILWDGLSTTPLFQPKNCRLIPLKEYFLAFDVTPQLGIDWAISGKLHGLAGGKATTGGEPAEDDGWSVRFVWKTDGQLKLYIYHQNRAGKYGDEFNLSNTYLKVGQKNRLTLKVKINDIGLANGQVKVWVDKNLKGSINNLELRGIVSKSNPALIDRFLFSTFYGGSTMQWAPRVTSKILFSDFLISSQNLFIQ